jgi:hypothetical protein
MGIATRESTALPALAECARKAGGLKNLRQNYRDTKVASYCEVDIGRFSVP